MTEQHELPKFHCSACGEDEPESNHSCLAGKNMKIIYHWLLDSLEAVGHDLGHYFTKLIKDNGRMVTKYAYAIADEMPSINRAEIHLELCKLIGVERKQFQPFESDEILNLPTREEAEEIAWDGVLEAMWTHTIIYKNHKKTYKQTLALKERYFGK